MSTSIRSPETETSATAGRISWAAPGAAQIVLHLEAVVAVANGGEVEVRQGLAGGGQIAQAAQLHGDLAGLYRELWNSTWPAFVVESEDEHTNGGRDARLHRGSWPIGCRPNTQFCK